jgi:hypothetical protein
MFDPGYLPRDPGPIGRSPSTFLALKIACLLLVVGFGLGASFFGVLPTLILFVPLEIAVLLIAAGLCVGSRGQSVRRVRPPISPRRPMIRRSTDFRRGTS